MRMTPLRQGAPDDVPFSRTLTRSVHFGQVRAHLAFNRRTTDADLLILSPMKLTVDIDDSLTEPEVLIRCAEMDSDMESLISSLRMHDRRIVAMSDGKTVLLPASEVLYIESVDGKAFAYTRKAVLEVRLKLYEMEDRLSDCGFTRVAKGCLVNLCHIASLQPYVGGRLLATISNDESILISRKYARKIKKLLGVG